MSKNISNHESLVETEQFILDNERLKVYKENRKTDPHLSVMAEDLRSKWITRNFFKKQEKKNSVKILAIKIIK